LSKLAPDLPGLPRDFSLYKFGRYQGKLDLANYSRVVEFYGQLQRGLKKMEMASSYYGFEVRMPLLDRRVIEASLRIDPFTNMKDNNRKQVLVKLLQRYVPREIIPTSKRGFAVPLGDWFRDSLRPVVEDMLFSADLYPTGLFNKKELRTYWEQHLRKEKDHKWGLWSILALQGWARANL
jgi:asparagine synthase (glutamine-hydrolysing)